MFLLDNKPFKLERTQHSIIWLENDPETILSYLQIALSQKNNYNKIHLLKRFGVLDLSIGLSLLLEALTNDNQELRKEIIIAFGSIRKPSKEIFHALFNALQDDSNIIRKASLVTLNRLLDLPEVHSSDNLIKEIAVLIRASTRDRSSISAFATKILKKLPSPKTMNTLLQLVQFAQSDTQIIAAQILATYSTSSEIIIPVLLAEFENPYHYKNWKEVAKTLQKLTMTEEESQKATTQLLSWIQLPNHNQKGEFPDDINLSIIDALGYVGDSQALDFFILTLDISHPFAWMSPQIIHSIGNMKEKASPAFFPLLKKLQQLETHYSSDILPTEHDIIAQTLGKIGHSILPEINKILKNRASSPFIQKCLISALSYMKEKSLQDIKILQQFALSEDESLQRRAIETLGKIDHPSNLDILTTALFSNSSSIQISAIRAIKRWNIKEPFIIEQLHSLRQESTQQTVIFEANLALLKTHHLMTLKEVFELFNYVLNSIQTHQENNQNHELNEKQLLPISLQLKKLSYLWNQKNLDDNLKERERLIFSLERQIQRISHIKQQDMRVFKKINMLEIIELLKETQENLLTDQLSLRWQQQFEKNLFGY